MSKHKENPATEGYFLLTSGIAFIVGWVVEPAIREELKELQSERFSNPFIRGFLKWLAQTLKPFEQQSVAAVLEWLRPAYNRQTLEERKEDQGGYIDEYPYGFCRMVERWFAGELVEMSWREERFGQDEEKVCFGRAGFPLFWVPLLRWGEVAAMLGVAQPGVQMDGEAYQWLLSGLLRWQAWKISLAFPKPLVLVAATYSYYNDSGWSPVFRLRLYWGSWREVDPRYCPEQVSLGNKVRVWEHVYLNGLEGMELFGKTDPGGLWILPGNEPMMVLKGEIPFYYREG